jgi:hypothetical protein
MEDWSPSATEESGSRGFFATLIGVFGGGLPPAILILLQLLTQMGNDPIAALEHQPHKDGNRNVRSGPQ